MKRFVIRGLACLLIAGLAFAVVVVVGAVKSSRERDNRQRSMQDILRIADALEAHAGATGSYPVCPMEPLPALEPQLRRAAAPALPLLDPWGEPYLVESSAAAYTITSWGADRRPGCGTPPTAAGDVDDPGADAVFSTGAFVTWRTNRWGD